MQPLNNMLDELARAWIMMYYWPYFLAGNADNIKEMMPWKFPGTICKP